MCSKNFRNFDSLDCKIYAFEMKKTIFFPVCKPKLLVGFQSSQLKCLLYTCWIKNIYVEELSWKSWKKNSEQTNFILISQFI